MGKEGEKESTERKLPFYSFQLLVPPRKSSLMGLGRKTMSLELWLCICPLRWCCPGRMAGTQHGRLRCCRPEPRAWRWRREGGQASRGRARRSSRRSLVGMEPEPPHSQAHMLPSAHGACPGASTSRFQGTGSDRPASRMLAALVSSYPVKYRPQPPSQP